MLARALLLVAAAAALCGADDDSLATPELLQSMARRGAGLDAALELWEPRALAGAWPRLAPALSAPCRQRLSALLAALARAPDATSWAVRALDASGRYSRRHNSGNYFWLGSRALCMELNDAAMGRSEDPDAADAVPPFPFTYHVAKMNLKHQLLDNRTVELGVCVPAACAENDTRAALEALDGGERGLSVAVSGVRAVRGAFSFWAEPRFYFMLGATLIVSFLVLIATLYDFFLLSSTEEKMRCHIQEDNNNVNASAQHNVTNANESNIRATCIKMNSNIFAYEKTYRGDSNSNTKLQREESNSARKVWKWRDDVSDSVIMQILLSFSLRTNLQKLCSLSSGDDTLTPIHGLRVFTLMWIVLVHACLITFQIADNKSLRKKAEQDFLFQTLSSGSYSVDTFFVMSGTLVAFLYYRTVSKMTMKELTWTEGYKAGILQFLGMTGYRFMRLTPTYLYALGIVVLSSKYYHDYSVMELPTKDHINCENYWWRNMLYINTFFAEKERCMTWSWYLANDTQFFTFGTILLILSISYFQVVVALVGILLLSAWTITAVLTISNQHRPSIEDPFANYEDLYDKPWIRVGPYFIGMCAGWILCKTNCQLQLHKGWIVLGWVLALSTMCSVVYGLYGIEFGPVLSAIYVSLGHSAWALATAWIIIACSTGNGGIVDKILSWPYLYPISRLSYCTYLIHPQIMRIILLNLDSSFHITIGMMGTVYGGFLLASYIAALIITLTFEAPMVSLLRIAHPMRRKKTG